MRLCHRLGPNLSLYWLFQEPMLSSKGQRTCHGLANQLLHRDNSWGGAGRFRPEGQLEIWNSNHTDLSCDTDAVVFWNSMLTAHFWDSYPSRQTIGPFRAFVKSEGLLSLIFSLLSSMRPPLESWCSNFIYVKIPPVAHQLTLVRRKSCRQSLPSHHHRSHGMVIYLCSMSNLIRNSSKRYSTHTQTSVIWPSSEETGKLEVVRRLSIPSAEFLESYALLAVLALAKFTFPVLKVAMHWSTLESVVVEARWADLPRWRAGVAVWSFTASRTCFASVSRTLAVLSWKSFCFAFHYMVQNNIIIKCLSKVILNLISDTIPR